MRRTRRQRPRKRVARKYNPSSLSAEEAIELIKEELYYRDWVHATENELFNFLSNVEEIVERVR